MATKRKRQDISLAQKYEVVQLLEQRVSQSEIARRLGMSQPTVSVIAKNRSQIKEDFESCANPDRKRQRMGNSATVDRALLEWFKTARHRDIPLNGPILMEKAKELSQKLNVEDFNASKGWLERWKARENIGFKRMHGEKKDADTSAAEHWKNNVLPQILLDYNPDDIYNADETGMYYRAIPDGTLSFKKETVCGSKKSKDRVTALVTANMSGSDKRRLLVIGKSKDPRCFRGKKSLPVKYESNKNSWMTSDIFKTWIKEFNKEMCKEKRKVILLVDNCSAHPKEAAERLTNVRLEFLPPNTTSVIQPCDQGIIRNLKCSYRSEVVKKILRDIEDSTLSANELAKRVTLLDAVHMLNKAWKSVKQETIQNCFRKAGFSQHNADSQEEVEAETTIPEGMTEEEFTEYVGQDDDLQCHHLPTEDDICADLLMEESRDADADDDEQEEEEFQLPVTIKQMRGLTKMARRFYEENNIQNFDSIYEMEELCEKAAEAARRQSKITEFIHWIP